MISINLLHKIKQWFENHQRAVIAISGGVDSTLVAMLAKQYLGSENTLAIISASESLKKRDLELTEQICSEKNIPLTIIKTDELQNPDYASNPINRCYFCKHTLYETLVDIAEERWGNEFSVMNGQNLDDFGDYRPGLMAAKKFQIFQPLADCGLGKKEVRELALYYGLPNWDKPASPCLSSRIPYGQPVTNDKLRQIEAAEEALIREGFNNVRVRHLGNTAKIEVPVSDLERLTEKFDNIQQKICSLGFEHCVIDEEGFVSGKLNRVINE